MKIMESMTVCSVGKHKLLCTRRISYHRAVKEMILLNILHTKRRMHFYYFMANGSILE